MKHADIIDKYSPPPSKKKKKIPCDIHTTNLPIVTNCITHCISVCYRSGEKSKGLRQRESLLKSRSFFFSYPQDMNDAVHIGQKNVCSLSLSLSLAPSPSSVRSDQIRSYVVLLVSEPSYYDTSILLWFPLPLF